MVKRRLLNKYLPHPPAPHDVVEISAWEARGDGARYLGSPLSPF